MIDSARLIRILEAWATHHDAKASDLLAESQRLTQEGYSYAPNAIARVVEVQRGHSIALREVIALVIEMEGTPDPEATR